MRTRRCWLIGLLVLTTFIFPTLGIAGDWFKLQDLENRVIDLDKVLYFSCKPFSQGGGVPHIVMAIVTANGEKEIRIAYDKSEQAESVYNSLLQHLNVK